MRGIIVFCILIALPALAAFGHDVYIAYDEHNPKNYTEFKEVFSLSDFGFLLHHYQKDTFDDLEGLVQNGTLSEGRLRYIIGLKAFHVGLGLAGICYLYLIIAFLYGIWPFKSVVEGAIASAYGPKRSDLTARQNREKGKKVTYKRK